MTTASPPGYSTLFATGLFLSTDVPIDSRSLTPTPISAIPHTPLERPSYIGSATLNIPNYPRTSRRPKLAALRTHSARASTSSNPPSAITPTSASVPSSPRVLRRRRSSITLSHNPMAAIKSPTRAAGMSGRAQTVLQALGSPTRERRTWSLDAVGERSFESGSENSPANKSTRRRPVVARKPPPTAPLPTPPVLPTLSLNMSFPSPASLSPALTPSPNVLPAPTPGAIELGLHKFSFANHRLGNKPARSPLVTSAAMNHPDPGYFDVPIRMNSPVLPMDME